MVLVMALFWLPIVAVTVWAIRQTAAPRRAHAASPSGEGRAPSAAQSASEIARRRYAGGEITREQYLQLVEDLDGPGERRARGAERD